MAICDATHRCKLAESLAQILLSVRIMARHLLGFAPFRFVIRLPMNFSRYSRSALSGACDIWLWISREAIRTFPRGCTNSPLQKRGKGDTLLHRLLWVLGCFVYLEVKNLGNQQHKQNRRFWLVAITANQNPRLPQRRSAVFPLFFSLST